jgi:hypothetical protein
MNDKPKRVRFINTHLRCLQGWCQMLWAVRDLNPLRKTVRDQAAAASCPADGGRDRL